jgi:exonuclease VII small subunit
LFSKVQAVDQERAVIIEEFDFRKKTLEDEKNLENTSVEQKALIDARLKALENEKTDALKANVAERNRVQYEEYLHAREMAEKMASLQSDLKIADLTLSSVTATSDQQRYYYAQKIAEEQVKQAKAAKDAAIANQQIAIAMNAIALMHHLPDVITEATLVDLAQKVLEATAALKQAEANAGTPNRNSPSGQAQQEILGGQTWGELWGRLTGNTTSKQQEADGGLNDFGEAVLGATDAVAGLAGAIMDTIAKFKQGKKEGGIAGGIGAILASGPLSDMLSSIPVVGGFVKPIGAILSIIGGLFKAAARRIAERMKREFDDIVKSYNNGQTGLAQAIKELEAKRAEAIRKLSGKKGGKEELDKLLPAFDDQIQSLKKQQKQVIENFEQQLDIIRLGNESLENFLKKLERY